jgi:hypothetical protein
VLKQKIERGVLLASGLIAGDALIGIVIAIFAYLKLDITVFGKNPLASNNWFSLTMFIVLAIFTYFYVLSGKNKQDSTLQKY